MIESPSSEMSFEVCMVLAIRGAGMEEAVGYIGFPIPTADQWKRCIQAVRDHGGDLQNPFDYISEWVGMLDEWADE